MDSYKMKVKERSRKKIKAFVKKYLTVSPRDLRVVCLPGKECLEIFEIWDAIGVPRENITCLERDKNVAKQIKRTVPWCSIEVCDFSEWIPRNRFHVASLDFQGMAKSFIPHLKVIKTLLLEDESVLYTNFFVGRETLDVKFDYCKAVSNGEFSLENRLEKTIMNWMDGDLPKLEKIEKIDVNKLKTLVINESMDAIESHKDTPLKNLRDVGITLLIADIFLEHSNFDISKQIEIEKNKMFFDKPRSDDDRHRLAWIFSAIMMKLEAPKKHKLNVFRPYSYVNYKGRTMFSDLFYFTKKSSPELLWLEKLFDGGLDKVFHRYTSIMDTVPPWERHKIKKAFFDKAQVALESIDKQKTLKDILNKTRESVGKESKLHRKLSIVEKKDYVLANFNKPTGVLSIETGASVGQIAAWKAHITRRKI